MDEDLVLYEEWELEACVSGALLAEQMGRVNAVPFTNEQLAILKRKLDQVGHDLGFRLRKMPKPPPTDWGVAVALTVNFPGSSTHRGTPSP